MVVDLIVCLYFFIGTIVSLTIGLAISEAVSIGEEIAVDF